MRIDSDMLTANKRIAFLTSSDTLLQQECVLRGSQLVARIRRLRPRGGLQQVVAMNQIGRGGGTDLELDVRESDGASRRSSLRLLIPTTPQIARSHDGGGGSGCGASDGVGDAQRERREGSTPSISIVEINIICMNDHH